MRACIVGLMLCTSALAIADDGSSIRLRGERVRPSDEPLLHLDHGFSVASQSPGATIDGKTTTLDLGRHVRLIGEAEWWQPSPLFAPGADDSARGWRAGGYLSIDLGLFRVGASVAYAHVDGRFQRGTYRVIGVSAYRTFRLSRWMLAWVALSVGKQTWLGDDPPPGEHDGTTMMLSIGTTFR